MTRRELLFLLSALPLSAQDFANDPILRALRDELNRAKSLKLPGVESPYYIEYGLDEMEVFITSATMGATVRTNENRTRVPRIQVRVGDASFDNTNYVFSDFFGAGRVGGMRIPIDDDYSVIRHHFWLATDRVYKGSVEAVARKRSALRNITQQEKLNDFAKAEAAKVLLPSTKIVRKHDDWVAMTRRLSGAFAAYPKVTGSSVEFETGYSTSYYINTEGTELRYPDDLFFVRIRGGAQAPDGMPVRDAAVFLSRTYDKLADEVTLKQGVVAVAQNVTDLAAAPVGEDYSGPVVVEGVAAAQMFAQLVGANLGLVRRPVAEPGRNFPFPESELQGRMNSRVLPEWMDVVDDPVQTSYEGQELQGSYPVDMEGVVPKPVTVIEGGTVKNFLLTRQPVRGFEGSNGRARLPGNFGAKAAVFSNLFVRARQTVPTPDLKKKLLELVSQRGKAYGILIRKLDFPTTASFDELRRMSAASGQRGELRIPALPLLVYRVYPDGREELVRGLKFRSLNVRSLRDIIAASDKETIFHFIGNGAPLPTLEPTGYVSAHSVAAPSVLFEDLELEKREEDWPKLPIVPPPPLVSTR
jgi:hypothetical protein